MLLARISLVGISRRGDGMGCFASNMLIDTRRSWCLGSTVVAAIPMTGIRVSLVGTGQLGGSMGELFGNTMGSTHLG